MKICLFGNYDSEYNRNLVLTEGLRRNGVTLINCHTDKKGWAAIKDLYKRHKQLPEPYDLLLVLYSDSRFLVPLAKLLTKKTVVWDAFYSMYDSVIFDRGLAGQYSAKALYLWLSDWFSCVLADKILLDTYAHIQYFSKTFHVSSTRFIRVLIGADYQALNLKTLSKE